MPLSNTDLNMNHFGPHATVDMNIISAVSKASLAPVELPHVEFMSLVMLLMCFIMFKSTGSSLLMIIDIVSTQEVINTAIFPLW